MIKLCGATCLVQYLDRSAIVGLPDPKIRIIATVDEEEDPVTFARVRLAGAGSLYKKDQILMVTTGREGSRVEFRDMLRTGEILYLLRDGDVLAEYEDAEV